MNFNVKFNLPIYFAKRNEKIDFRDEIYEKELEYDMREKQCEPISDLHEILSPK